MSTEVFIATPVISADAIYTAGDAVGGLLEFEDVCSAFDASGLIVGAILIDKDKESDLTKLLLFDREITPTADNAALDVSDTDLEKIIAEVTFAAADYVDMNDNSACFTYDEIPFVLVDGGTSLFGLLVAGETPTYTAVDDLIVKLIIRQ